MIPLVTQIEDAAWLAAHPHGALFHEPGCGKTLSAILGWQQVGGTLVVVAPLIAQDMWVREIFAHTGVKAEKITKGSQIIDTTARAYVLTYGLADKFKGRLTPHVLILDESDALKTLSAARTKAIYGTRASMKNCLAESAAYIWPLTGTPIRRYADDLYPQLKALHPAALKAAGITSLDGYQTRFCKMEVRRFGSRLQSIVTGSRDEAGLRDLIGRADVALRRRLVDVAVNMPPVTIRPLTVDLADIGGIAEAMSDVSAHARAAKVSLEDAIIAMMDAESTSIATLRRLIGVAKVPDIVTYVTDTLDGNRHTMPILLFFWHRDVGDVLENTFELRGLRVRRIDGSTSQRDRTAAEADFNARACDVLLGQISTMGVALNLQAGSHHAVFAERDWSFAAQDQALRRLWRMGQTAHVQVDLMVADHPLDRALDRIVSGKEVSAARVLRA